MDNQALAQKPATHGFPTAAQAMDAIGSAAGAAHDFPLQAVRKVGSAASDAVGAVAGQARDVSAKARAAADAALGAGQGWAQSARETVRERPLAALAIAAVFGLLFASLRSSRR